MATLPTRKTDIKPADPLTQVQSTERAEVLSLVAGNLNKIPAAERATYEAMSLAEIRAYLNDGPELVPSKVVEQKLIAPRAFASSPVVTFHVAPSRKTLMANAQSRIALKSPQIDSDSHAITLFWNPRPAANATPADPQSISIGAQNAPRLVYTGYGVTIPAGYRGIIVSLPEHGPVRPLMYLLAGKHDIDLAVPHSYAGTNVHGVQIGPCAAVGRLILERSVEVVCEVVE